eukprot:GHVQ01013366.1.p1 GENE.GHVQ01013366.1~~GHVQ01013366.1.p1  ORF type:complete len:254 (-),score=54.67 GHVQ01013366.1:586-1347(-)
MVQQEQRKKRDMEQNLINQTNREMQAESAAEQERKRLQQLANATTLMDNSASRREKQEKKIQQQAEDLRLLAENEAVEAQREAQKEAEMNSRLMRQKQLMDRMADTVVKITDQKDEIAATRAQRQQEVASAKQLERESKKAQELKKMREETRDFLFKQMAEKSERKIAESESKRRQAEALKADTEAFLESEKNTSRSRRLRNIQHKEELNKQIEEHSCKKEPAMSPSEICMNSDLLKKVAAEIGAGAPLNNDF